MSDRVLTLETPAVFGGGPIPNDPARAAFLALFDTHSVDPADFALAVHFIGAWLEVVEAQLFLGAPHEIDIGAEAPIVCHVVTTLVLPEMQARGFVVPRFADYDLDPVGWLCDARQFFNNSGAFVLRGDQVAAESLLAAVTGTRH